MIVLVLGLFLWSRKGPISKKSLLESQLIKNWQIVVQAHHPKASVLFKLGMRLKLFLPIGPLTDRQ